MTTTADRPVEQKARSHKAYRVGESRLAVRIASYTVLIVVAAIYIFPFLIELGTAFKTDADASNHPLNPIPQTWTTNAFHELAQADFPRWFANSLIVAVCVTVGK